MVSFPITSQVIFSDVEFVVSDSFASLPLWTISRHPGDLWAPCPPLASAVRASQWPPCSTLVPVEPLEWPCWSAVRHTRSPGWARPPFCSTGAGSPWAPGPSVSDLHTPLLPMLDIFCLFHWTSFPLRVPRSRPSRPSRTGPLALGFLWWLEREWGEEAGVGTEVPSCLSSHPSASGLGAAPPGADHRSGPTNPWKPWSQGLLTCLLFCLTLRVEHLPLNWPLLHNHFVKTSSFCWLADSFSLGFFLYTRGPLFWYFNINHALAAELLIAIPAAQIDQYPQGPLPRFSK